MLGDAILVCHPSKGVLCATRNCIRTFVTLWQKGSCESAMGFRNHGDFTIARERTFGTLGTETGDLSDHET